MKYIVVTGSVLAIAVHASAQELLVSVNETSLGSWEITGELLNPVGDVLAVLSDFIFEMQGAGFSNYVYNDAYDSDFFGPATLTVSPTVINFAGYNLGGPLANAGGPDSSNPISLAIFSADEVLDFNLVGQNAGYYDSDGKFPIVFFYQDAQGNPGTVPFRIEINPIPSPATALLFTVSGIVGMQRRR